MRAASRPMLGMQLLDGRHRVLTELRRNAGRQRARTSRVEHVRPARSRARPARRAGPLPVGAAPGIDDGRGRRARAPRRSGTRPRHAARMRTTGDSPRCGRMPCSPATAPAGRRAAGWARRWRTWASRSAGWWSTRAAPCRSTTGTASTRCAIPRRPATYMQVGPGRYRWEFMVMPGETEAELAQPEVFLALTRPWLRGVDVTQLTVLRQAIYTFRSLVADRWRRGRLFLAGRRRPPDAALHRTGHVRRHPRRRQPDLEARPGAGRPGRTTRCSTPIRRSAVHTCGA